MKLLRRSSVTVAGLALAIAGGAFAAETQNLVKGQWRTYRQNELRTSLGFDPDDPTGQGLKSNQMPAFKVKYTDSRGTAGWLPNPDLTWFYPLDVEGAGFDDPGNAYPLGYTLGQIRSSATVAGVMVGGDDITPELAMTVMFGSTTMVRRDVRNNLPGTRVGDFSTDASGTEVYDANSDPYNYLNMQNTGCVFSLEGFAGTTELAEFTNFSRNFKPFWWYGVRNLPYYLVPQDEIGNASTSSQGTFAGSPSLAQHRFFINASDTAMRAFDYSPEESRSSTSPYSTEDATIEKPGREAVATQWMMPAVANTTDIKGTGPGIDSGAGPVGPNRADIPERVTDRLYNLSITGKAFGLVENAGKTKGDVFSGPLDNRFRQANGMGPINSTGAFVRLQVPVSYISAYYNYDTNLQHVRDDRRDPLKIVKEAGLATEQLYIVGSDDGYLYAFDADPRGARRVPATGGGSLTSTYMGRLVWAFHAAARVPVYSTLNGSTRSQVAVITTPPGEYIPTLSGDTVNAKSDGPLLAPYAPIVSGAIISSPVSAEIALPSTAFSHPGQTRVVVFVGSAMGRMFCIDAATGLEEWEFKTTPLGQGILRTGDAKNPTYITYDSVAGNPINTSPTLGFLPTAKSQLRPGAADATGRLALFFGCDDGKVYALDAADGSPIRDGTSAGWDVTDSVQGGTIGTTSTNGTRYRLDHFGFVAYPFEKVTTSGTVILPDTKVNSQSGRLVPAQSKPLLATVVARPIAGSPYIEPSSGHVIPQIDAIFVTSPTNQNDATIGAEAGLSGGTIFCVNPLNGTVKWTFDRWNDVTRDVNTDFDKTPATDYTIRPSAFNVTPAYATGQQIFSEVNEAVSAGSGEGSPLKDQSILFAIDNNGRVYPLRAGPADDAKASVDRLYWRLPYSLPGNVAGTAGLYSSPVVSSPLMLTSSYPAAAGRSYVFIGVTTGVLALDTTSARTQPVTDVHNKLMTPATTGGELSWGWEVDSDVPTTDTSVDPPVTSLQPVQQPVVSTPVIHAGYVYAGGDNGLLYAWANQLPDFDFGNVGGGGRTGYRNRGQRGPAPDRVRPSGGASVAGDLEFYVDIFQAGFGYNFTTPQAFQGTAAPTGGPPGNAAKLGPTTPQPVGVANANFQAANGALLEWGDPVGVVAWGPGLDTEAAKAKTDWGTLTFQLTGPGTTATLKGSLESSGTTGFSRQIFYLNPFGESVPIGLRYPMAPQSEYVNPLHGQLLAPGWRGSGYTVTAFYQAPDLVDVVNGKEVRRRQASQRVKIASLTKFRLGNPINMMGHFTPGDATTVPAPLLATATTPVTPTTDQEKEVDRNGNERIPIETSVIGDHGTNTIPQNLVTVVDRSHLPQLRALANSKLAGSGDNIYLRVRVQGNRLRWVGGPKAAYKPLLVNTGNLPNGLPSSLGTLPPEPLYAQATDPNLPSYWGPQIASAQDPNAHVYIGAETPPFVTGEENKSLDYPDIDAGKTTWLREPTMAGDTESDATLDDAPLFPNGFANFSMRVAVPKYQPANYSPPNIDPGDQSKVSGVGPGYYTINPTNNSAAAAALLAWNPAGRSLGAGLYGAFTDPSHTNAQQYYAGGINNPLLPTSNAFVAREQQYLTKVYADVNGNGSPDTDAGEAYRMFVSGAQVRPNESLKVATTTIDVPRSPESSIPAGYIPFQYYYDNQAVTAGASPGDEDRLLFGERSYYAPFAVYNTGNVNLWSLRLDKYDPLAAHLEAPEIDQNPYLGADEHSNWPGSGKLKRFNLASTIDPLPKSGAGGPSDPRLWTPVRKPTPGAIGDDGNGRIIQVKDVFAASPSTAPDAPNLWAAGYVRRQHNATGVASPPGLPYLTVAIPPGTPPGRYSTPNGRFVVFEDIQFAAGKFTSGDGVLTPGESGVSADSVVTVNVGEARLTDKTSRLAPFLPNADTGVAMSATFATPNDLASLGKVWQSLAQDTTPSAFRDPSTGDLVTFWSSNRVGEVGSSGFQPIAPFVPKAEAASKYHIFASAMTWQDPTNPPINYGANVNQFLTGVLAQNPWGWQYQGGNTGGLFLFPNFGAPARWFGAPSAEPWLPDNATVADALGVKPGEISASDLNYTSPAPLTEYHGTNFPRVVFWVGTTGIGADQRSAIFYAPIAVDRSNATVGISGGSIQAVGVVNGLRSLDPFTPKYGPRPFLITAGGTLTKNGAEVGSAYLTGERVIGLGVAWFGGAPGAWKLYVSTIATDNTGAISKDATWKTTQLALPTGVGSALHPSVYYHQMPKVLLDSSNAKYRQGVLEVAFTGYNRSARNPDIYVVRYVAMKSAEDGSAATVGGWGTMGFARKGADPRSIDNKPLDPLIRVAGEPRPIFRSRWADWLGRGPLGTVVYWFQKPVAPQGQPSNDNDYRLFATFTSRNPGNNQGGIVEVTGHMAAGGNLPNVTAFIDAGGGTVRFTTSDPVGHPAPMTVPHSDANNVLVQDFVFVAMNPYALRVTADDDISDTMPQIWIDETHEVVTDPTETNAPITATNPLVIRRDRMWVLWRRSAAPEGATRQSSLFYQTYRLGVDTGVAPIPLDSKGKLPVISFTDTSGAQVDLYVTVDRKNGRLFFTGANDGDVVDVYMGGSKVGRFTIGWIPEGIPAPVRYGTAGGDFRLPMETWTQPRAVPTQAQGNDSVPWMFKDPFSDVPPGDPLYYVRGNNSMWLFWESTRPSRSAGNTTSVPSLIQSKPVDPYYYQIFDDPKSSFGGLMYAGSASDVYYTTLSPDFRNK
ncbi:MAG TPA: hypothetical protein VGM51_05230 [Armatimonadota bacterium]|jgi:hypothetical protein